jgi:hypothetical protein
VLVGFGGRPRDGVCGPVLGSLERERLTVASVPELLEVDAAASGLDRSVDHEFYLTDGGRYGWLLRRRGRAVAYVMVRQDGWVGPVAALRERDIYTATACGIADLMRRGVDQAVRGGVTGRCEGAQRAFWEAGLVFDGTPGLLLASRPFGRLDRYVVASYGLF